MSSCCTALGLRRRKGAPVKHRACLFLSALCLPLAWSVVVGCGAEFSTGGSAASGGTTTTAAGGTGGGITAGGMGGFGATGGASTGAEDCANGLDDDGDQLIDCADSDCTGGGFACLLASDGWTPVAIRAGVDGACSGVYDTPLVAGGVGVTSAEPPECSCPTCASPANAGCGGSSATFYTQQGCGGTAMPTTLAPNGCSGVGGGPTGSIIVNPPALNGACQAVTTDVFPSDPPAFVGAARLCEGAELGAGCEAGLACAPPTGATRCAVKAGDVACPSPFLKTKYFTDFVDGRQCNCSCQLAGGCTGDVSFHDSNTCSDAIVSVPADGQCRSVTSVGGNPVIYAHLTATSSATCQPHASPSGSVSPAGPMTLCCLP